MLQNTILKFIHEDGWQFLANGETPSGHLFHTWITVMLSAVLICFVVGEWTRNYSQVDKVWSMMPVAYSWITLAAFPSSPRLWLMTALITLWGVRLSYNFYRKGGYNILPWKGDEDYRWSVVRQHPKLQSGLRLTLFNLFFISFYQHLLILFFSTPLLLAVQHAGIGLSWLDYLAASFMLLFIVIETIADNQQHLFQQQKRHKIPFNGQFTSSLGKGFMIEGLWSYVRHPNFAAEQAIWVSFYFMGIAASGQWINWTLIGPLLLILLFVGSTALTERVNSEKYPDYAAYKQNVPKFVPLLFKSTHRPHKSE
jgi:steroid 5-alpha reductase family enzyme